MARQFERADHCASSGETQPNPRLRLAATRHGKRRRTYQEKPIARPEPTGETSSDERASSQGADTDDASVTPMRQNPRTGSEAGSPAAAEDVVETESDAAAT